MLTPILIVLSGIVMISSAVPYIIEIIRGKTKPRIVSWAIWTLLTSIATAASFVDGQYPAAALSLAVTIQTGSIVVLGLRHGDRKLTRLDVVCVIGAVVGLVLWYVFNSPAIAVLAAVTIDLIGVIPTIHHAWWRPSEETWLTFLMASLSGGLTVLVAGSWRATAIAYPLYLLIINLLIVVVLLGRGGRSLDQKQSSTE
jgi:hypothetical protein